MSKACKTCKGRGRWQEKVELADGSTELNWQYCEDCNGSGVDQDPELGDAYDIDGDSYADE